MAVACGYSKTARYNLWKVFGKKAGFVSRKWVPAFANYRRDGYDFDALYEDGKAPLKYKKIMKHFMEENADNEIFSNELKKQAGYGKDGEKDLMVLLLIL